MASPYQEIIREALTGRDYDPRHIEAFMRLQYGTLNHLSLDDFEREIEICIACIGLMGKESAEETARSFGL
jgi:hypothetical protein